MRWTAWLHLPQPMCTSTDPMVISPAFFGATAFKNVTAKPIGDFSNLYRLSTLPDGQRNAD